MASYREIRKMALDIEREKRDNALKRAHEDLQKTRRKSLAKFYLGTDKLEPEYEHEAKLERDEERLKTLLSEYEP